MRLVCVALFIQVALSANLMEVVEQLQIHTGCATDIQEDDCFVLLDDHVAHRLHRGGIRLAAETYSLSEEARRAGYYNSSDDAVYMMEFDVLKVTFPKGKEKGNFGFVGPPSIRLFSPKALGSFKHLEPSSRVAIKQPLGVFLTRRNDEIVVSAGKKSFTVVPEHPEIILRRIASMNCKKVKDAAAGVSLIDATQRLTTSGRFRYHRTVSHFGQYVDVANCLRVMQSQHKWRCIRKF